jgi:hypothetical protein
LKELHLSAKKYSKEINEIDFVTDHKGPYHRNPVFGEKDIVERRRGQKEERKEEQS